AGAGAGARLHRVDRRVPGRVHRQDGGDHRGAARPGAGQGVGRDGAALMPIPAPPVAIMALLPVLVILGTAALVLLLDPLPGESKEHLGGVALAGIVGALLAALWQWGSPVRAFSDMVLLDDYALFFDVVICYAAALI